MKTTYERQFISAFQNIAEGIKGSDYPMFEAQVAKQAWDLQVDSDLRFRYKKRRTPLSLDKEFYVYVYMDPRKPGTFTYTLANGRSLTLPYEPFYVGKGNEKRPYAHSKLAGNQPRPVPGQYRINIIRKLNRLGLSPIVKILTKPEIEAVALVKERILIKAIGRRGEGTGPLTNYTDGGEGTTGLIMSKESKDKMSQSHMGKRYSKELRLKISLGNKGKPHGPCSVEHKRKLSVAHKGKTLTAEHRNKIRQAQKTLAPLTCPYCETEGHPSPMKRYHFDNCKTRRHQAS